VKADSPQGPTKFTDLFGLTPPITQPLKVADLERRAFGDDLSLRDGPMTLASQAKTLSLRPIIEAKPYAYGLLRESPHPLTIANPKTGERSVVVILYWYDDAKNPVMKLGFIPEDSFSRTFSSK
jgi:hypothetical protein